MISTRRGSASSIQERDPIELASSQESVSSDEELEVNGSLELKTAVDKGTGSKMKPVDSPYRSFRSRTCCKLSSYILCFCVGWLSGFFNLQDPRNSTDSSQFIDYSKTDHSEALPTSTFTQSQLILSNFTLSKKKEPLDILKAVLPEPPPLLIIVTPTYIRPFQAMYLHRLSNWLRVAPGPLLWLVVEIGKQSRETASILRHTGLMYRHLASPKNMTNVKDRGVQQRNTAMAHIEEHRLDGIVYFADDDNIYTEELFHEIRRVKRFGVMPVAFLQQGKAKPVIEGPVCEGKKVIGWHTNIKSKMLRRFHVDMCGFAFNSTILWDPRRWNRPTSKPIRQLDTVKEGFQETTFIEQLVPDESYMEALANGCSKVLVFHTHLEGNKSSPFHHWNSRTRLPVTTPLNTVMKK